MYNARTVASWAKENSKYSNFEDQVSRLIKDKALEGGDSFFVSVKEAEKVLLEKLRSELIKNDYSCSEIEMERKMFSDDKDDWYETTFNMTISWKHHIAG